MDTDPKFEKQVITEITIGSLLSSAINGIVAFIAVYFFKPLWERIIKAVDWNKK